MTCPLCNDTGNQRYWEGRWRDEKAENERLRAALRQIAKLKPYYEFDWGCKAQNIASEALNETQ